MKSGSWIGSALLVVGVVALALWRAGVFTPAPPKRPNVQAACKALDTPAFERAVADVNAAVAAKDAPALARSLTSLDAAIPSLIPLALARPLDDLRKAARALPPMLANLETTTVSDAQIDSHLKSLGAAMSNLGELCRDNPGP